MTSIASTLPMSKRLLSVTRLTYRKLVEIAGKLQAELKRPVSFDDAINT